MEQSHTNQVFALILDNYIAGKLFNYNVCTLSNLIYFKCTTFCQHYRVKMACKGKLLFSSVEQVTLIHVH